MRETCKAVLFDLDGTLVDTAPDLAYSLNQTLQRHGRAPLPMARIRPQVSHGTEALLRLGFGIDADDPGYAALRDDLLTSYQANLSRASRLFDGMETLLSSLEERGIAWGIVTNKPAFLTEPLARDLALSPRCACIVSGDTLSHSKPHPEPVLHACRLAASSPQQSLYVGDAERDILAGRRAGTRTLVARWGYLGDDDCIEHWQADGIIDAPLAILDWLD